MKMIMRLSLLYIFLSIAAIGFPGAPDDRMYIVEGDETNYPVFVFKIPTYDTFSQSSIKVAIWNSGRVVWR